MIAGHHVQVESVPPGQQEGENQATAEQRHRHHQGGGGDLREECKQ